MQQIIFQQREIFFFSPDDVSMHATSSATSLPQRRVSAPRQHLSAASAPQCRVSVPSQHITNELAQPRGPAAYTPRPTQRATRVSTRPATRDLRVPCSQAHTYTAHPTRSPALQAQKHVTSPLAQTSRSSTTSPDPRLPALQAHMRATRSSAKRTTPFNSPSTSSRVQMTHFPDLCPVFDPVEKHNFGHRTQSYRCLSLRLDKG